MAMDRLTDEVRQASLWTMAFAGDMREQGAVNEREASGTVKLQEVEVGEVHEFKL